MSAEDAIEIDPQALKELQLLDDTLSDIDAELMAKKVLQMAPVLTQRQQTIDKIPGFWAVVFDNAATELEAAITPADGEIFAKALTRLEVLRPEIPAGASHTDSGLDKFGEPRSVTINFHFKQNEWFSDSVLSKTLYFRYSTDGSTGLVSDPIKINWKAGKDLTEGLTDAAYELWTAQKQNPSQQLDGVLSSDARKARDAQAKELPQYKALAKLLEDKVDGAISFFNFFSYRGRWTSAAENKEATIKAKAHREAALAGKPVEEEDDEDEDYEFAEEDVETFPPGHDVAVTIAEDIWPDAIDYFFADTIDSDIEIDEDDDDEDEDVEME
ncbi:putative nap family protein [Paramyrothecium foliicola]|nr:putative nap family protein [Paramyrothecium foliicola]